jgi:glycosyltransferase domain-containing protein
MNERSPLVSVIIPTYNRPNFVKRAIESVLNQTYKNIEIIIVDGSPNDETEKILSPYLKDSRIRYIHQKEIHQGTKEDRRNIAKARNTAIKLAKGKYIATLDDDDVWIDERKLEKQVKFLEGNPDYIACGGNSVVCYEDNPQKLIFVPLRKETNEEIKKAMFFEYFAPTSSLCFLKSAWEKVGGYDEGPLLAEDCDFVCKLGKIGKLYNFPEYFVKVSKGKEHKINAKKFGRRRTLDLFKVMSKYRNDYPGYQKATLENWINYFYSYIPFNEKIRPILGKIKRAVFEPILSRLFKS